ncbi:hypothetical protein [Arenimonas composti]|uniref:AsmA domain-containing protein n=1 Tax=Arenimonas composti TR7-09 = DSM 18010 TaxID=1121013 RepID=A0A091C385_9GAMM|nr:hypothetical protein [Arenimonas composti]KFN51105.1 hypothetical protein P873_04175 [Arenimonas composti TR7-09 = DSM 18010]
MSPAAAATPTTRTPKRRRWPRVLAVLAILLLAAAWWIDHQLEPHRLANTVLARAGAALGLELSYEGDPDYALRPEPRLRLPRFSARVPGAATPLLTADRLEVSLPWSTILDGEAVVITRIELDAPRLDLAALNAWLDSRPPSDAPFELPTLTDGLRITDGRIDGDGWSLQALEVSLPRLVPQTPADALIAGEFRRADLAVDFRGRLQQATAGLRSPTLAEFAGTWSAGDIAMPWQFKLGGDLDLGDEAWRLGHLSLAADGRLPPATAEGAETAAPGPAWQLGASGDLGATADGGIGGGLRFSFGGEDQLPALDGEGELAIGDTIALDFAGLLTRWPATWPVLPGAAVTADDPLAWSLTYTGDRELGAPVSLHAERGDTRLFTRLTVPELQAWLETETGSPLPPLAGTFEAPSLQFGSVSFEGVRLRIEDDGDDGDAAADADAAATGSP